MGLKILIIATAPNSTLKETLEKRGHAVTVVRPTDFSIYIPNDTKENDLLYLNDLPFPAKSYDAVISRVGQNVEFAAKILQHLQKNLGVWCIQSGRSIEICKDKVLSGQIASSAGLRVPKQFYCTSTDNPNKLIEKLGGLPVILKEISGSKGKGIILLESPLQTNMTLESYYGSGRKIILQEYLNTRNEKTGGSDERHIVVNGEIVSSMERTAPTNDIRANLSLAGQGRKITPTWEVRQMCRDICKAIPGLLFAGVDIIQTVEKTKQGAEIKRPHFIEINSNPGEKIIEVTGKNHFVDLAEFIENNYQNKSLGTMANAEMMNTQAALNLFELIATQDQHYILKSYFDNEEYDAAKFSAAVLDLITSGGKYPDRLPKFFQDVHNKKNR